MLYNGTIWVGTSENQPVCLLPQMANRHGLIAGATGTGKTVSLKVMAEGFSDMGVPVFLSDVKGDLSGMVKPGESSDKIVSRLMTCGVNNFNYKSYPTIFWDVYGEQGHPVRTTVSEMGPLLLGRMLGLNDTQIGVLHIVFRVADAEGLLLLDLKDLKAMLAYVGENAERYTLNYGNISKPSLGVIQRSIAVLEDQGGNKFFGEPALNMQDWIHVNEEGRGNINILASDKLFQHPTMYSTFLLWMLSELYETLPEQGDLDKPRMVFFFDEAHLLFNNCSKELLEKVEQVVRLIRSKGVGVYFITQNPTDIPMTVLSQLGNRVQHALRAFTPLDQRAVKVAAQTFRANPAFDTETAITQLQTGEALVSFLDNTGAPGIVSRTIILPPQSYIGAIDAATRATFINESPFHGLYENMVDRQSAYEYLAGTLNQGKGMISPMPAASPFNTVSGAMPVMAPQAAPVFPMPAAPVAPAAPVTAAPSTAFMVFDPTTGQYVQKQIDSLSPLPEAPIVPAAAPIPAPAPVAAIPMAQAPVAPVPVSQPMPGVQQQTIQQNVLVQDPTTGQYVQKLMTMAYNPATGQYVPVVSEAEQKAAAKTQKEAAAAQAKEQREAERQEKERIAAERREKADALRDERAERARANNSIMGRMKNTAINQVTRTVTNQLTRGLLGGITGRKW